jgi:hypothetical protein
MMTFLKKSGYLSVKQLVVNWLCYYVVHVSKYFLENAENNRYQTVGEDTGRVDIQGQLQLKFDNTVDSSVANLLEAPGKKNWCVSGSWPNSQSMLKLLKFRIMQ